ncbi:hypothetical protein [Methanosarcina sp. 1.H.A.2.2]|uniref:DUF7289 family protein n=1 Tax=Methanosarcina sp. 1.H.A.2.2 TaxID=1483601 RepID=UPI0006210602|nr:hypothetical protein [Methanosarcina sp. 1.H.A.2.2]KKH49352.1 hypothetical protein EO93_16285 [Methanosarcina sp. 1.H.A.2.2]
MKLKFIKPFSSFLKSDSGVSVAVAAALLLGIVVLFITNIQVYHVPQWKEDAEYSHMSEVYEDMSRLKCNIDLLSLGMVVSPNSEVVLNSPLRMGGGNLPVVNRMKSGGTLVFNKDKCNLSAFITYNNSTSKNIPSTGSLECGALSYRADNSQYLDQIYCYENGALIVSQGNQSFMKLSPGITLEKGGGFLNLSVNAVCLAGSNWVLSSNSVEDLRLVSLSREHQYDVTGLESFYNTTSVSLTIFTDYPEAWETYFETQAKNENLWSSDYELSSNSSAVFFRLTPVSDDLNVKVYNSLIVVEAL